MISVGMVQALWVSCAYLITIVYNRNVCTGIAL